MKEFKLPIFGEEVIAAIKEPFNCFKKEFIESIEILNKILRNLILIKTL